MRIASYNTSKWCYGRSNDLYEGYAVDAPSTSNSIESTHKHIKTDKDLTTKKPLRQFLGVTSSGLIHNWSMKYNPEGNPNVLEFSKVPTLENKDWLEAFEWNKRNKRVISFAIEEKTYAFTYAGEETGRTALNKEICRNFIMQQKLKAWNSFDHLIQARNSIHIIEVNKEDWKNSHCSCNKYLKQNKCKHIIAISAFIGLTSFDEIAMSLPLSKKVKRGRKPNRTPALIREASNVLVSEPQIAVDQVSEVSEVSEEEIIEPIFIGDREEKTDSPR